MAYVRRPESIHICISVAFENIVMQLCIGFLKSGFQTKNLHLSFYTQAWIQDLVNESVYGIVIVLGTETTRPRNIADRQAYGTTQ